MGSDIFRGSVYGAGHPLNIARVWPVIDICFELGWLSDSMYRHVEPATAAQLAMFHTSDYISALIDAEHDQSLDAARMERHRIGKDNNPIFPQIYARPATAAHASMIGAEMLAQGQADIVYNPAGGTHHGMPDRANGFCFVNDPALAIAVLIEAGIDKIAYIDIDAHHADGVQDWLSHVAQLRLISIHQGSAWPRTGASDDRGAGSARNYALEDGAGDEALLALLTTKVTKEIAAFDPTYIIIQAGADGHQDDPQSKLNYSLSGYWQAIDFILSYQKPTLILGGGGYNPYTTARAWAGIWGMIAGFSPEQTDLNPAASEVLKQLQWEHRLGRNPPAGWFTHLADRLD